MAIRCKHSVWIVFFLSALSVGATPPKFYSINSLFGISLRDVNSVCEDTHGFIWASSKTGIVRLTNDDYRIYHLAYDSPDIITVKLVSAQSQLVAYTNNGQIFLYDPVYDRFDLLVNLSKKLNDPYLIIRSLVIGKSGDCWIASSAGLFTFQSGALSLITKTSFFHYALTWYNDQQLIIAGTEGIRLLDTQSLQSKTIWESTELFPLLVSSLYFDPSRELLWIGTISNGLYCYAFHSGVCSRVLPSIFPKQPVLAIEANTDSTLLVGVDGQGIWKLDAEKGELLDVYKESADDPSSLRGNGVYAIFCDKDQRVWIATISGGVSYFDQASPLVTHYEHQINNSNSLVNNDVNSITEDREGKLWFATNNGISCLDATSGQWKNFYYNKREQAQVFLSLCTDDRGRIWVGSYSSGVYVLNEKTGRELAHYAEGISGSPFISNFIMDIFKDSQGDIWMGGVNGPFVSYLSEEDKFRTYSFEPIGSFAELSPGRILLGCSYGLSLLDKETGTIEKILLGMVVNDILVREDILWICSGGDGLIRFEPKSGATKKFTTAEGLPSNFVNSIVYADESLWLGTEHGLCRFHPENHQVVTFSSLAPLSGISYNKSSPFKTKKGQLAWGTNKGAIFFDPGAIKKTPLTGRIFLQDLFISGRSVTEISTFSLNNPVDRMQSIELTYSQNNLSLELLPIGTPPGSRFSWKMEGFDQNWTPPAQNRILTYTNLPSGDFRLRIRLYDNALSQIIDERSLAIQMTPPFWKKGWFFFLVFGLSAGLILLYLLYAMNRLKQKHTEEKIRFFTNTAHDIRTALTLIKGPIEELRQEQKLSGRGRTYLDLAIEQARQLSAVVTRLMDFQKMDIGKEKVSLSMVDIPDLISNRIIMFESFAKNKRVELAFASDPIHFSTAVDESKMEKIVDNLISNAIKYAHPDNPVEITAKSDEYTWELQVKDHGIGISEKAQRHLFKEFYRGENAVNKKIVGSGIGLLLVKKYVTLHNGSIDFESQENKGSTFRIVIPRKEVSVEKKRTEQPTATAPFPGALQSSQKPVGRKMHLPGRLRILVVEDNDDLLNFMHTTLESEFKVTTARDGNIAWQCIAKQIPDLVISDVMMPNMDGFELCRLLKSTYETSHIPVILLTALSEETEQLHGLGLGADDYITKPFDMNLLKQRIKTIIRNRSIVRDKTLKIIQDPSDEPVLKNTLNDAFVKKMLEVAQTNISNPEFSKDEFAAAMNVSPSLLYKKIKSFTDQSPTRFIKTIRLNHALKLLQAKKYTVTEVSELCGFTSVGYFSTTFKKFFGKSPTLYLKKR
jgi:signal transduction histidine kinase/CheY-like chemotaxis protein/ligand-binding sensor domain-containing protein